MSPAVGSRKLSLLELTALVVGSMIGSGIFALPAAFAANTGVNGALLAWAIAGTGMLMLAFVFQSLSRLKPELDTGIYAYAKAGFGDYAGLLSAVGYWLGCCLADVACLILIKATLGQFFPVFGDGTTGTGASPVHTYKAKGTYTVSLVVSDGYQDSAATASTVAVPNQPPVAVLQGDAVGRRDFVVATKQLVKAAGDEDVAARRGEGVDLAVVDHAEGPRQVRAAAARGQPATDQVDPLLHRRVLHQRRGQGRPNLYTIHLKASFWRGHRLHRG